MSGARRLGSAAKTFARLPTAPKALNTSSGASDFASWDLKEGAASEARVAAHCRKRWATRQPQAVRHRARQAIDRAIEPTTGRGDAPLRPLRDYLQQSLSFCDWIISAPEPSLPATAAVSLRTTAQAASAAAVAAPLPPAHLLAVHLTATHTRYHPHRRVLPYKRAFAVKGAVDRFLSSAGMPGRVAEHAARTINHGLGNGSLQLHLLHDSADAELQAQTTIYRGVHLYRAPPVVAGTSLLPAHDARWHLYAPLLRSIAETDASACVFLVDFSDVRPIRDVSATGIQRAPLAAAYRRSHVRVPFLTDPAAVCRACGGYSLRGLRCVQRRRRTQVPSPPAQCLRLRALGAAARLPLTT